MNKQLKAKWVKALRSGKYEQAADVLATRNGAAFCCLGVLADVQGCTWKLDHDGSGLIPIAKDRSRPMVGSTDCELPKTHAGGLTHEPQAVLMKMNDDHKSFAEIADYIEKNL